MIQPTRPATASALRSAAGPPERPGIVVDGPGAFAAGAIGLVMAGGAGALVCGGASPALAAGLDLFIGASVGSRMAEVNGGSRLVGGLAGAATGGALAAAGILGGLPGALAAAGLAAVVRGVVLPTMLSR